MAQTCFKKKIGIDIDDTCWNLIDPWLNIFNEWTNSEIIPEQILSWDIGSYVDPEYSKYLMNILFDKELWAVIQPIKDSQMYLKQLCEEYDVYIITASHWDNVPMKFKRFIELYPFIDTKKIIVTCDKQVINVALMVDDGSHNLIGGDYNKIIHTKPWNKSVNCVEYGILRADNWEEIYKGIHTLLPTE